MKLGKAYRVVGQGSGFPFDCQYGIYVGEVRSGFLRFVWDGKDLLMNGGNFEEAIIEVKDAPLEQANTKKD